MARDEFPVEGFGEDDYPNEYFPVEHLRVPPDFNTEAVSLPSDILTAPWTIPKVDQAFRIFSESTLHHLIVDERVSDLWYAAYRCILARLIWEGWLVDWANSLKDESNEELKPDPDVPGLLYQFCDKALYRLVDAGAIRTRYEDTSLEEILNRLPPTDFEEPWGQHPGQPSFHFCCSKVEELIPLQRQLVRLQEHFESSPHSECEFAIIPFGERTDGDCPGTFLELFVGYIPSEDKYAVERKPLSGQYGGAKQQLPRSPASATEKVEDVQPTAKTKSGSVLLFGNVDSPIVQGTEKAKLTKPQYNVIQALIEAGEEGLTKDELDRKSGHGDSRKILKRLADSDADWKSVIPFPGKPGRGYRII